VQVGFLFHMQVYKDFKPYVAEGWYVDDVEIVAGPLLWRNSESFEATDFWDHWSSDNGTWEVGVPTYGPTNAVQGVKVAGTILAGDYCDAYFGRDSRLVSPLVWLPASGTPTLGFQHWHNFNLDDYGALEVRPAGGAWEELQRFTGTSNAKWYSGTQVLTNYLGREIQLGFRFHSQYNKNGKAYVAPGWYLDQVEVRSGSSGFTPRRSSGTVCTSRKAPWPHSRPSTPQQAGSTGWRQEPPTVRPLTRTWASFLGAGRMPRSGLLLDHPDTRQSVQPGD